MTPRRLAAFWNMVPVADASKAIQQFQPRRLDNEGDHPALLLNTLEGCIMTKQRATGSHRTSRKATKKTRARKTILKVARVAPASRKKPISRVKVAAKAATIALELADPTLANLSKIDHIVVLMMENRSFDHLLGYLKLELGKTVDGLISGMSNTFQGKTFAVHRLTNTAFPDGEDPCHSGACGAEQLSNSNGGFVANFAHTYPHAPDPGLVMGYYNDAAIPVYDLLAKRFCICDRWFCSVDGSTWPNRLYSLAGRAAGSKDNKSVPLYNLPTFVRHLENQKVSWNWYAFDVSTLRLVDPQFRLGMFDHFRWVKHPTQPSFLRDAAAGKLASVSWIDPNFSDFGFTGNDDHPPSDLKHGQELVLEVFHAITTSPLWNKTLLLIVYDEHGGLFDHVTPKIAEDDSPKFRSYGLRVPAFVVSPWVTPGSVSSMTFDHTSIIKTILLRFCRDPAGAIPDMGRRVTAANHLGSTIAATAPTPAVDLDHLIALVTSWKTMEFHKTFTASAELRAQPGKPNELQAGLAKARKKLIQKGHPEGHP
jgi:phospholipase C